MTKSYTNELIEELLEANSMTLSKATGLPDVPERFYWRVGEDYGYPYVELRSRGRFFTWSESRRFGIFTVHGTEFQKHEIAQQLETPNIIAAAIRCLKKYNTDNRTRLAWQKVSSKLGDYPPKKLGA